MRLDGKVSIITGGGSGMGRVAAELFAKEGASVVVADFSEAAGEAAVAAVVAAGGKASFVKVDVSSEDDARAMVQHAVAMYGRVDTLYNNAGIMPEADHSVIDTDVPTWTRSWRSTSAACSSAASTRSRRCSSRAAGRSSTWRASSPSSAAPCRRRVHGVEGRGHGAHPLVAVQFAGRGVRSNSISPGPVETPLLMEWLLKDEAAKQLRLARNPSGRFGKPEEIVNAAIYLASDESRWTNGANFVIDGGITVQLLLAKVTGAGPASIAPRIMSPPGVTPVDSDTPHSDADETAAEHGAGAVPAVDKPALRWCRTRPWRPRSRTRRSSWWPRIPRSTGRMRRAPRPVPP